MCRVEKVFLGGINHGVWGRANRSVTLYIRATPGSRGVCKSKNNTIMYPNPPHHPPLLKVISSKHILPIYTILLSSPHFSPLHLPSPISPSHHPIIQPTFHHHPQTSLLHPTSNPPITPSIHVISICHSQFTTSFPFFPTSDAFSPPISHSQPIFLAFLSGTLALPHSQVPFSGKK